jgi:hypothetical protein
MNNNFSFFCQTTIFFDFSIFKAARPFQLFWHEHDYFLRLFAHEHEDRIFRATIFRFRAAQAKSMGRPLFTREKAKSDPMETSWVTGGILELCPPPRRVRFAAF